MPAKFESVYAEYAAEKVHLKTSKANRISPRERLGSAELRQASGGELGLLRTIRTRAGAVRPGRVSTATVRLGIGDDCALLRPGAGDELAVTTDLSIEGRHFRLDWHPPESVGHRTLVRGLSDLAAMGAQPLAAFLSLGLPHALARSRGKARPWIERFLDGLLAAAAEYRVPLAGGDLAEAPVALADIVLIGSVPDGQALLRSGAKPGDLIYVTGSLGGAAAEFERLGASPRRFARATAAAAGYPNVHPHLYPQPRLKQGIWLRGHGASAAMDLSDGLSTDLDHLCKESGVAAEIDATLLPLGAGATLEMALSGGEDYELLFTAPEAAKLARRIAGVPVTRIGRILRRPAGQPRVALLLDGTRRALEPRGWEHFGKSRK